MTHETKVPGMAVTALAGEIVEALLADEKDGGYDLTAGLFGPSFSALVRRWAAAEWFGITNAREISDEAIKAAALAAGAAKFYPDAQSKKPWGEESFLVTGGFLQRFAKAVCTDFPADAEANKKAARWQPVAPLDSCTDPYNCARCKAHPAHRQGLHHAGISGSSRKEDSES
ncbi:hypothetical protein Daci_3401 [Delftia acidovorans SPH-1]|uniref:Uncharacterized protein n=1 Tax=Delftia acidovorans (strain DSM 14801 / SPH-1) TaxID=398578 RepID=A9C295_DELAS|nr:hypothetical protein [Delftia acidovorans]ABX36039.1 hypothetical protein Daci_3401 [Delftia acidovorans SPH-1]QPS74681.1 hypothetical protein I6G48_29430 [Delftia acidovorans]